MVWFEVAMIAFSCVMAIHMGLIDAILKVYGIQDKEIPIIRCPKCLTFQSVLWFMVLFTSYNVIICVATAFLTSYLAIWFDLLLGILWSYYERIYNNLSEEGGETS